MAGFSSRSEESIERKLNVELLPLCNSEIELIENYDLHKCVSWIIDKQIEKVCLQFPDSLLSDSRRIAQWLENQLGRKVFILGDTSYGSCCVDEVAAEHVKADGIIHFGHSCLSPTVRLPVLYKFPKNKLDVKKCISVLREYCVNDSTSTVLVLFDTSYTHHTLSIKDGLLDIHNIIVAEPIVDVVHKEPCSESCCLLSGQDKHAIYKLGRGYCLNGVNEPNHIIFIGPNSSRLLYNYRISSSGNVYYYTEDGCLESVSKGKVLQRRWYLIERIRDAKAVGIVVGTLGVDGYLEAVKRVSTLVRRKGKKCYVISIGKPTVAKLANFSEIDVFVLISCPEATLENEKEFYQPIVSIMEAEMALNEARPWSEVTSSNFRDIIPGGADYIEIPETIAESEPDVSLISNKIRYTAELIETTTEPSQELQLRANMTVGNIGSHLSERSWNGLDPALGNVPVVKAVPGRCGIPQAYSEEEKHSAS